MQNPACSMLDENSTFAGRYHIVRRLASGGMGALYEARHVETGRACALKVMLAHVAENASARERFRLEARAAALVTSAHVVEVLDAGVDEATGSPFLVMELLRGEDLGRRVARLGPLAPEEVAIFIYQAARGLDALHRASIVHRDLKPSNLFLAQRDGIDIVKVLDLGVAKRVIDTAATTAVVGTPLYMAPEQMANGKITPAADEYALAMVAYSLLVGQEYWAAEAEAATSTIAFALLTMAGPKELATERAAKLGITLPFAFDGWFARAAAPDPDIRFPSVLDAAMALCEALGVDSSVLRTELERKSSTSNSIKPSAPQFDAFAPTMPDILADKPHAKTVTPADGKSSGIRQDAVGYAETQLDDHPRTTKRRRMAIAVAATLLIAIGVRGFVLRHEQTPTPAPAPPLAITALNCGPAEITGPGASPHLADALSKGACARLGIELGVPWLDPQGARLLVHAEMHDDRSAHVTLNVAGQKADAEEKTLIGATNEAIKKLAPSLQVPPLSPERIARWGTRDEASARRIERAIRQKAFGFADRLEIAKKVVATDGDSPVPHAMLACASKNTNSALAIAEKKEALQRLSLLPPKRAKLIHANLIGFVPTPDDHDSGPDFLDSYAELADDPDFASLFSMCGCIWHEALLPMVDGLAKHAPVMGLPIITCAIGSDEANRRRVEQYITWTKATLPEWQGTQISRLIRLGRIDEARSAQEVVELLGGELTTRNDIAASKTLLAFASFEPNRAITVAEELMGDPDSDTSREGAQQRIDALIFAGKIRTAIAAADLETIMLERAKKDTQLLALAGDQLRLRRLLGRPAPSAQWLERIDQAIAKSAIVDHGEAKVELALLRAPKAAEKKSTSRPDKLLDNIPTSQLGDDFRKVYSLPAIRIYRGNDEAAATYREIGQVNARQYVGFEAGLAFEAIGAKAEAEQAYRLCMEEPWYFPFDAIAARVRLAEMARAEGREDEARELIAIVDRAWEEADPDLRDIVRKMK